MAAFRMSFVVTPALAALEDEAPLTEWAPKVDVSMPDSSSRDLSQRATVLDVTGRFGFMIANSSLVSFPRIGLVFASYALSVITGHSVGLSGRDGKKKLAICEPCLDCFARAWG